MAFGMEYRNILSLKNLLKKMIKKYMLYSFSTISKLKNIKFHQFLNIIFKRKMF